MSILILTAGSMFLLCLIVRLSIINLPEQTALNVIGGSTMLLLLGIIALLMFTSVGDYTASPGIGLSGVVYGLFAYYLLSRSVRKKPSMFELAGLKKSKKVVAES